MPKGPKKLPETEKAKEILKFAREAVSSFWKICESMRKSRSKKGGALTYKEEDLLRAMLVFSGAALDSLLKQVIRDCLFILAKQDQAIQRELEVFVSRRIRDEVDLQTPKAATGNTFIARILVSSMPLEKIIDEYVKSLTGDSLQSTSQFNKAIRALGIDPKSLEIDSDKLDRIFEARNQIVHEFDIFSKSPSSKTRSRRTRTLDDMHDYSEYLLKMSDKIICAVEGKMRSAI